MSEIEEVLDKVTDLNRAVRPQEAEDCLRGLLLAMGPAELRVWERDIEGSINGFLPKRRRTLTELFVLLKRGEVPHSYPIEPLQASTTANQPVSELALAAAPAAQVTLRDVLEGLSRQHLFQFATFYRDELGQFFAQTLETLQAGAATGGNAASVTQLMRAHTLETFNKGYVYARRSVDQQDAIAKSMSGLVRFLDLPVEFYSARVSTTATAAAANQLRELSSAMISGILLGFSDLELGPDRGFELLSRQIKSWIHVSAFLKRGDLETVIDVLPDTGAVDGQRGCLLPFAGAIDQLVIESSGYLPLPVLSQYADSECRLTISLQPPAYAPERQLVEVLLFMDPERVTSAMLGSATKREVGAIVATLRPETRTAASQHELFNEVFVSVMEDLRATEQRLLETLETGIYRRRSPRLGSRPLEYNFAREFPLTNPFLTRYVFVVRSSVRDLLRTFERRNGVRLWCSVRRSGKTTAGLDLATTTGDSTLINQTCDSTGQSPNDSLLYDDVCRALATGQQLSPTFLRDALARCVDGGAAADHRQVLVLDEYETLFGQLRTATAFDERLRYTVAQPLLNQLVAFARDNLLVFLGQQPTAHFILMDQNQLSPYVEQDSFPLFRHSEDDVDEFSEFLNRVFAHRATFDNSFANRIFVETAGHPYLTVNLLVEFVEWLIRNKRPTDQLQFTGADASAFASRALRRDRISTSPEYEFFRDGAIPQALSPAGRRQTPWLFAMYSIIRTISRDNPESFTCTRAEFVELVDRLDLAELGLGADTLLTTGAQSNFLTYTDRIVAPRVRLLGRIAAVSVPAVSG